MISLAASQNFSNQGVLQQIVEALNEFRNECVNAINELSAQEADAVAAFEERVQQLNIEYAEFQAQLNDANVDMNATVGNPLLF